MQIVKVTRDYIFSTACGKDVLLEIAVKYLGYTQEAAEKLATVQLSKGANGKGARSNGVGDLPQNKLRTIVVQKLQDSTDYGDTFKTNELQLEIDCLPDLDIGKAGANKAKRTTASGTKGHSGPLTGAYVVANRNGSKCTAESDPDKWQIWQHIWTCNTFEEYFSKAPKKGTTAKGRVITASSEMLWAVKSGWIKPVAAEQKQDAA